MFARHPAGRVLTLGDGVAAVYGGAVLGGGGGGSIEAGLEMVRAALEAGSPRLVPATDLDPGDPVVTVGLVGSPAAPSARVVPADYVRAARLLEADAAGDGWPSPKGFIANENGAVASVNGWLQAAVTGLPVVDCPCDGRAHPTAVMGALGLHREASYMSRQAAAGGDPAAGLYLELVVRGGLAGTSATIRETAVRAGGLVAVARNPVPVSRAVSHGAPGAIGQAIIVGRALLDGGFAGVAGLFAAKATFRGQVRSVELRTTGGFDVGSLTIEPEGVGPDEARPDKALRVDFWNEYVTLEDGQGRRLCTFPDLIAIFALPSQRPLTSADIRPGQDVQVLGVRREEIKVGAAVLDPDLLQAVETAVGKVIVG